MRFKNTENGGCKSRCMHIFHKALLAGLLAVLSFPLYAQDTDYQEFWFVAPDASKSHSDRPTFLMITTGDKPAKVTISMPANPREFTPRTLNIPANSSQKYGFSTDAEIDLIENAYSSSGIPTKKGIHITSTAPVSVYYQIDGNNQKEIFTLKGKKALGKDFYMPFQTVYHISDRVAYNNEQFRQIQIVATEDGTQVTIYPKTNAVFKAASGTINSDSDLQDRTVTLNKGETLLWRENVRNTPNITGTRINSDKPIAITYFEDCVQDGHDKSVDPIGDQMVPVDNLGQNYIVVKGFSSGVVTDNAGVLAVKEGTTNLWWRAEGQSKDHLVTLQQNQYYSIPLGKGIDSPGAYYIRTDKPVYCMHQSATGSELGGAILPSLYSISQRRIAFIKGDDTYERNAMFLIFRDSAKDGFKMNGKSFGELFAGTNNYKPKSIGHDDWMYAKVDIKNVKPLTDRVCVVENNKGAFALGYFMGSTTPTALYGYLSAFGTFSFASDTIYHCGDSYLFDAPYALSYEWTLPDGSTITSSGFEAKKSGPYKLTVNQDPYKLSDETYLKLQNFNHILEAPARLLENKSFHFTVELNPQKDRDNYYNASYEWDFGQDATVKSGSLNERAAEIFYSTPGTKTIKLHIRNNDAICDTTIIRTIKVVATPEEMYWKTDAHNGDWNNKDNWTDATGTPLSIVPSAYAKVFIPGNAAVFPSLSEDITDWSRYGQPETKEIVFCYGGELHYQHKLRYEKAYIQFNWGYYGGNPVSGQQSSNSLGNAKILARDTWHTLAAPLKGMASGDFSLAGHPFSWQKQFKVATKPQGAVLEGDFSLPFPTNDIPLTDNHNAIAVKMAGYRNLTGYRQECLEGLKGVLTIPYFENKGEEPFHPAHYYDVLLEKSYFYYYDTKTLKIINSPVGTMDRAAGAYRFVYETKQATPPTSGVYEMPLGINNPGGAGEVMVGNPFLAPIDAVAFATANTGRINTKKGYLLLSDDGLTWQHKPFEAGNTIPAWKAFIVTLQPSASTLSFPLEAARLRSAAATGGTNYGLGQAGDAILMGVSKGGAASGDQAVLQAGNHATTPDIKKVILPEGHNTPEIFFMSSGRDQSYLVRSLGQGEMEIPIGVKTSDTRSRLSIVFSNIPAFSAATGASVVLLDKSLGVRHDLNRDPAYHFTQLASGLDNQHVDRNRFSLRLDGGTGETAADGDASGINATYRSGILTVTSDENIDAVAVYDMYGRQLFSARSINLARYTRAVPLQAKLLLVQVKTVSGKEKTKKIIPN